MSKVIDERVVEMRFDNKQFEKETKTTMNTLSKLKEALKFPGAEESLKNIDKAAQNIHLEGIAAGVEMLTKRFSTFGIVGMQIIQNVTNALTNKLAAAMNYVSDAIVSGGIKRAMNIENAHFQLQALLKDEAKVQAVMDNAMESVDGTAYAYDEAAKAASMFAASGLQAGEEMLQALKGITGVAAMTNSDFESMSMIFTTVAGNGRLMGDQLLQLSSRGLNAASTIADYFREVRGEAEVTESTIREMVTDGKVSFKDFSDAMSWAFGDSAKRANETFTGAMSNMKSALARIGAGFVSPLVEQNGEMVNLFNALRIKINEVKSALVFDEQTSALSGMTKETQLMVQTVANLTKEGKINFDQFTSAILGTKKSEEELSEINERLAVTFGSIREEGFASNEALHAINQDGIRAYDAIVQYMNGVTDGTIRATGELKRSVRELTEGTEVSAENVFEFAKQGKISFDIFNNAIVNYSGLVDKNTKLTTEALKAMFKSVKDAGGVTNDMLNEFNKNGVSATASLVKYINGVTDGTVRASYATKKAIEDMTDKTKITTKELRKFADEGKISFEIFQSAMEHSFGDSKTLSKQFTDFTLNSLKSLVNFINNLDVSKPMEIFYSGFESIKNVVKGLGTVLKPVGTAFSNVFKGFSVDDVAKVASSIENLTSKFKISETASENLYKAFKGVFDVVDSLIGVVGRFIKALNPSFEPITKLGSGALGLAGNLGECLSKFAEWINTSETVNKVIKTMANLIGAAQAKIKEFTAWIKNLFAEIKKSPITDKVLSTLSKGLTSLSKSVKDFVKSFGEGIKEIPKFFSEIFGGESEEGVDDMTGGFDKLQESADKLNFDKPMSAFEKFRASVQNLSDLLMGNKGINTFVTNLNSFFDKMIDSFKVETLSSRIDMVTSTLDKFIVWIKKNMEPIFGDLSLGGVVAAGSGIGMIYSIMKMAKSFESMANKIKAIPDILGPLKSTLTAYQNDLKADQLVKTATAIGILAGALTIMSFADWDQIWKAAVTLAAVSVIVMKALSKFLTAANKASTIPDVLDTIAAGLKKALKNFGRALLVKSVTSGIKDLGKTMAYVTASLGAIFYMNKTDPKSLWAAVDIVKGIGEVMAAVLVVLGGFSQLTPGPGATASLAGMSGSILAMSVSLGIIVGSVNKLFKMDIPTDYELKLQILTLLMLGLAGLMSAVAYVSGYMGGNAIMTSAPIVSLAGSLFIIVQALGNLFKMTLPTDWEAKVEILVGIIVGMGVIMFALNSSASAATGTLKAGGTLIGLAAVLLALTWSISELSAIPLNQLGRAVFALDGVMVGLAIVFANMDNLAGSKDAGKSVLYMAVTVGAIAVALGILSMIPLDLIAKSVVALDAVLLALALDFAAISKINNDNTYKSVFGMVVMTAAITVELMFLSGQPWEGLLAGAGALSMVLLAMAAAFKIISETTLDYKLDTLYMFLSMIVTVSAITGALFILAECPWEGLLAAGAALSMVLLAFAGAFKIIGETVVEYDLQTFLLMASLVAAIWLIVEPIEFLADKPWDGLLAAGTAISEVLLAISAAALICSKIKTTMTAGLTAVAFIAEFVAGIGLILAIAGGLRRKVAESGGNLDEILQEGSGLLAIIAKGIGLFVGSLFEGFSVGVAASLVKFGEGLNGFMTASGTFFQDIADIKEGSTKGLKNLAEMVLIITAADILEGIGAFFTKGMSMQKFGAELKSFGEPLKEFAEQTKDIDENKVQGAANAALIMAKVAESLPKVSGIGVKIFGTNKSLSDFGEELGKFGEKLAPFCEAVKDITGDQVQGAADAGQILAEMSKTLPRANGFAQKIFGTTKNLSEFGEELSLFAPGLLVFAIACKDITADSVRGAADAATILSTMAENMPNTNTLWENLFGGGTMSITEFTSDLITFAENMVEFSKELVEFDDSKISNVVESFEALADLAVYVGDKDAWNLVNFTNAFELIASEAVDNFVSTFENSGDKAKEAIGTMIGYTVEAVNNSGPAIKLASGLLGGILVTALAEGITNKQAIATSRVRELSDSIINTLSTTLTASKVNGIAQTAFQGIVSALNTKKTIIISNIRMLTASIISTTRTTLQASQFVNIAQTALQGLVNGINNKKPLIMTTIRTMCQQMISTTRNNLTQNTFNGIGSAIVQWMITGINLKKSQVQTTISGLCALIVNSVQTGLPASTFTEMGAAIASALVTGLASQAEAVAREAQNLVDIANQATSAAQQQIQSQSEEVNKAASQLVADINKTISQTNTTKTADTIGQNVSKGVGNGIKKQQSSVTNSTKKVAKSVTTTFQKTLEIHSPSQVMIDLAEYISLGIAEGITNKEADVQAAIDNIAEIIVTTLEKLMDTSYGERIALAIADGISNKQPEIEDAIDRIVNSVTEKLETLKQTIDETLAELSDKELNFETVITPSIDDEAVLEPEVDTNKFVGEIADAVSYFKDPSEPALNNPVNPYKPVYSGPMVDPILGSGAVSYFREDFGLGDPFDAEEYFKVNLGDPIEGNFAKAIQESANNAQSIQSEIKYTQDQNALQNDQICKKLDELTEAVNAGGVSKPPQENIFHITGSDPLDIAQEVSKILQHQVEREETKWA